MRRNDVMKSIKLALILLEILVKHDDGAGASHATTICEKGSLGPSSFGIATSLKKYGTTLAVREGVRTRDKRVL